MVGIDPIRATLDQIETQARRSTLGVNALTELAQRISPLRDDLRDKLADLEPRLADVDARLKGLGAAPVPPATEDPAIAAERTRLTQQRNELDSAIKQVQLLQARATQLTSDAHRPAQGRLRGDHVPQVAECARSLFLARRGDGAAGLRRAPREARAGLDRLRAGSGRPGADHVRCGRARGTPDLRDRLHPLVAAAGLHCADRRPLRHGARLPCGVPAPGADGADRGVRRAATARPVSAHPGWLRAPGIGPHFRHRDGGAGARGSDKRARAR